MTRWSTKTGGREGDYTRAMGVLNAVYLAGASAAALLGGATAQRALAALYVLNIAVDLLAILLLIPLRVHTVARERGGRPDPLVDLRALLSCLRDVACLA
ncbi:MAG: hypothetical protein ACM3ZC_12955 [Bacteroidota bacterium]